MSEYNMNKLNNPEPIRNESDNKSTPEQNKPQFGMALLAGFGAAVIVAIILAILGIITGSEYIIVLVIGAILVGVAVKNFVPAHSIGGALIGAILCPLTYFLYQLIMAMFGYYYEKDGDSTFWFLLIGSAFCGAYICYSKSDD